MGGTGIWALPSECTVTGITSCPFSVRQRVRSVARVLWITSQYLPAGSPVCIQLLLSGPNVPGSVPGSALISTNPRRPRPNAIWRWPLLHQCATGSQLALTAFRNPTIFAMGRQRCSHIHLELSSKQVLRHLPSSLTQTLRVIQSPAVA